MKLVTVILLALLSTGLATDCVTPTLLTRERCLNPPVIRRLDIPAYTGRWFNTFVSGSAVEFAFDCVTANYTLTEEGTIDVLNCSFNKTADRPACLPGVATRRPGLPSSRLQVSFRPGMPPGSYNVAAVLGRRNYGYFAAAVYSCEIVNGVPVEGLFIITRAPYAPGFVKERLMERLRCKGYLFSDELVPTPHSRMCKYFDGEDGFDTFGVDFFGGPPQS